MIDLEDYIKKHFKYDTITGTLSRDDRKGGLGSKDKDGYLIIKVKGKQFKYHRIVWLLNYGEFPKTELDHIDRNKLNNKITNLRLADRTIQNNNKEVVINKDTNEEHIYYDKTTKGLKAKYCVRKNGKTFRFRSLEDAKRKREELWT